MTETAAITPLPLLPGSRRLLLMGGTFDPPHTAHCEMAVAACGWLDSGESTRNESAGASRRPTQIVFVPAARSPFKPPPRVGDAERLEMLRALATEIPGAGVWTDELDRALPGQASYWVSTLERAHAAIVAASSAESIPCPLPELCFLIGTDQAIALHRWRDTRRILELARPTIVLRQPVSSVAALRSALREADYWSDGEIDYLSSRIAPSALSAVNATAIREALAAGHTPSEHDLTPAVLAVIRRLGLYRAP